MGCMFAVSVSYMLYVAVRLFIAMFFFSPLLLYNFEHLNLRK